MSPEEEASLANLLAKQKAEYGAPVLQLLPGGGSNDPNKERARSFLRDIEQGRINEYVLVGLAPNQQTLSMVYSHAPASFSILGALSATLHVLRRTITG
jgi:hypothetical protein